ncbi:unnamed protein product [Eretmochelys imbricata]
MKCGMRRLAELGEAPRGACWSPKEGESVWAAGCQERTPEDKVEAPSGIGDLVLAAELMEVTGASPCNAQHRGGTQPATQHDHGAYGIPQEPAALGRMVRELQEMVHRQSQLLQSSQEALAASQERCQELQERSESECWVLASELGQRIAALEAENRNLRCERDQLESRTRGLREELERSRSSMLHVGQKLKEQGSRAGPGRAWPGLASVRDDSKWLRFYTGFGSAQRLAAFLAFLTEGEPRRGAEPGPPSTLRPSSSWCWCGWGWGCSCRIWPFASSSPRPPPPATGSAGPSSWRPGWPRCRCGAARVERFEPQRASWVGGVPRVVLDCAQLRFKGRGRQLYALQGCALATPSGFLAFCCSGEACLQVLSLADKALRFRFLHGVQPPTMEGQVGRAWAICCYLACLLHEPMGLA